MACPPYRDSLFLEKFYTAFLLFLEVEVVLGIVVADVLNHLAEAFHLTCGDFAILHVLAKEVTQGAAEVLMTRVGEERT